MKKVMFISSTGGHLHELLQLEPLFKYYDYLLITEKTKSNMWLKDKYNTKYLCYGTRKNPFKYFFIAIANIIKSFYLFIKFRPDCIVTTGTHTAVPMCYIAHIFCKKVVSIETMANSKSKTLSGKLVYPIADLFVVQWESMLELYPEAKCFGVIE